MHICVKFEGILVGGLEGIVRTWSHLEGWSERETLGKDGRDKKTHVV